MLNSSLSLCKLLCNYKRFLSLFIFAVLYTTSSIGTGFLAPSFWGYWLNNCYDNGYNLIEGCNADYITYNLISNIAASINGFIIFTFGSFIGNLSDKYGRRYFIGYSVLIYLLQRINVLIVTNIWVYYVYYSLFLGLTESVFVSYAGDILKNNDKIIGFGGFQSMIGLGFTFGTLFVIVLSVLYNNYFVFVGLAILSLVILIYWYVFIKESLNETNNETNLCINPYKTLFNIFKINDIILYCSIIIFLCQMDIIVLYGTLLPFIGDQFSDILVDESSTNIYFGLIGLIGGFGGIISNTIILHYINKYLSNIQIMLFGHILVFIGLILFGLVPYIKYINLLPIYSFIIGLGGISITSVNSLSSKYLNNNNQGIGFGIIESYKSMANILGPGTFALLYYYFSTYTQFPSFHWFLVALTRFMAIIITIFPLKNAIKNRKETNIHDTKILMTNKEPDIYSTFNE